MTFRFLHTADLHLDSPLRSLALRNPDLAEEVATASRDALRRIVDLCLSQEVHALLIAGDLWDSGQTSAKTPRFLKQELTRLSEAGIRCFLIRGNHDAASKIRNELDPPPLTRIFDTRPGTESFTVEGQEIAVHGISFPAGAVPESLLPRYPAPIPGAFNIGLMHTSLNGSAGHDLYAPCTVAELMAHGYDYWALGHIHRRSQHLGAAAVVMPGIPQGRDIGEAGATSVTLGTFDGTLTLREESVASLQFLRLPIDVSGIEDWGQLLDHLQDRLQAEAKAKTAKHLVLRPELTGATPLAFRIARDHDRLLQELTAMAETRPGLWIDKLSTRTTGPQGSLALPEALVAGLGAWPSDPGTRQALIAAAREMTANLPADLASLLGDTPEEEEAALAALLERGMSSLLPRLALPEDL